MTGQTRLLLAAALCAASLGLGWSATDGDLQMNTTYDAGSCSTGYDGYLSCTTGTIGFYYTPGFGYTNRGYADDARVVLVPAAVALAWAARRRTRRSEQVVRVASVALAVVAIRAGADGQTAGAMVGVVAAALAWSALRSPAGRPASPPAAPPVVAPGMATAQPGAAF